MLAGEIAFSTSTLKRLVEQSANDPESSKTQVKFCSFLSHIPYTQFEFVSAVMQVNYQKAYFDINLC